GGGEDVTFGRHDQREHFLALGQTHAAHAGGGAAHRAHGGRGDAHSLAVGGEQQDVAVAVGELDVDQRVALVQLDRLLALLQLERELGERSLLHRAVPGGEEHVAIVAVLAYRQDRLHLLARGQRQQVDDRLAARARTRLRHLVDLEPVHAAGTGEGEQGVVGVHHPQLLDHVLVLQRRGRAALAAALLRAIRAGRLALDVAGVRQRDHHVFRRDQV